MKILQIASDFFDTQVHLNLYRRLAEKGVEQVVYCPVRSAEHIGRNAFENGHVSIVYDYVLRPYHRYLYHLKQRKLLASLQRHEGWQDAGLVHASTLFSDGGLAYNVYRRYGIPYVVAVRNADVNAFLRCRPETWAMGRDILLHARSVIFLSPSLMQHVRRHPAMRSLWPRIESKLQLIPNGIDDYYLDRVHHNPHSGHDVLYVGRFSALKNVNRLCRAVLRISAVPGLEDVRLTLIGGGNDKRKRVARRLSAHPERFRYLGPIYDKQQLCEAFDAHALLAMPSLRETFGLVYLESLSRNLPVVYTRGQGVDGLLPACAGRAVSARSVQAIAEALQEILSHPGQFGNEGIDFEDYRWERIVGRYMELYSLFQKQSGNQ